MKTLNQSQKLALWMGIALVLAAGLCPPWKSGGTPLPYALIFHPPVPIGNADVHLDFERLAVQWVMAVVVTAGLIFSTEKAKGDAKTNLPGSERDNRSPANAATKDAPILSLAPKANGQKSASDSKSVVGLKNGSGLKVAESLPAARVIKFPENRSLGEILIESEDDPDYWESLAVAKGDVQIPAGRHIQFELDKHNAGSLDFLADLPADAFYSMDLSGSRISDGDLEKLQRFSDLRELDLSDTSVTDAGIKHLQALNKLKKLWLDNTDVSEQGLESLRDLGQLTKVSLIGVKVSEPEAQTLKIKLSNCEIVLRDSKA